MNRAMFVSATGMAAEQQRLDNISENLANADVSGYKENELEFTSLAAGGQNFGVSASEKTVNFARGRIVESNGPMDIAIDGNGFFAVKRPDCTFAYTRDGQFERAADGSVRNRDGNTLEGVNVPASAKNITVDPNGSVWYDTATATHQSAGQIRVAVFPTPERLRAVDGHTFEATPSAGQPQLVVPGTGASGHLAFHALEKSNVSVMESMMEILSAQRAFEANSKGVQAADEMQRIANNIERS